MAQVKPMEYVLKMAGKRRVTLPHQIVSTLKLAEGDRMSIVIHSPTDIRLVRYRLPRKDLMTPEIRKELAERRREIQEGAPLISLDTVLKRAAAKRAAVKAAAKLNPRVKLQEAQGATE